jgi:ATP-dependent Clp protease ATP-binding subunit ClpX
MDIMFEVPDIEGKKSVKITKDVVLQKEKDVMKLVQRQAEISA